VGLSAVELRAVTLVCFEESKLTYAYTLLFTGLALNDAIFCNSTSSFSAVVILASPLSIKNKRTCCAGT
jgi:hypothetical protein